mgnify:FL=1
MNKISFLFHLTNETKKAWDGKFGRKEYNIVLELDGSSIISIGIDTFVAGDGFLVTKLVSNKSEW